jgi:DNA polymerase III delta prime subunit
MTTPFIQKYIPRRVDELFLDDSYIQFIRRLIDMDSLNILFQGEDGYGKTSVIRCILNDYMAKHLNTDYEHKKNIFMSDNVMWLNQWDENIQSWRETLVMFCKKIQQFQCKKLVILDDIDLLNVSFQQIIRSMIEEYSEKIHFICSCKNPQNVVETIQSRLYMVRLHPIKRSNIEKIYTKIVDENRLNITSTAKQLLLTRSTDVKHLISNLEKIKLLKYSVVNTKELREILLNIQYADFVQYMEYCTECAKTFDNDLFRRSYQILEKYYHDGYSVNDILEEFFLFLKQFHEEEDTIKYKIVICLMETISIFHTMHEHPVELVFFTNNCIQKLTTISHIVDGTH